MFDNSLETPAEKAGLTPEFRKALAELPIEKRESLAAEISTGRKNLDKRIKAEQKAKRDEEAMLQIAEIKERLEKKMDAKQAMPARQTESPGDRQWDEKVARPRPSGFSRFLSIFSVFNRPNSGK